MSYLITNTEKQIEKYKILLFMLENEKEQLIEKLSGINNKMRYLTNKENDIELKSALSIFTSQIDDHKKGNLMLCVI